MNNNWAALLLLLVTGGCRDQQRQAGLAIKPYPFPALRDTVQRALQPLAATGQARMEHPVLYIGPSRYILPVRYHLTTIRMRPAESNNASEEWAHYHPMSEAYVRRSSLKRHYQHILSAQQAHVQVAVDTTQQVGYQEVYSSSWNNQSRSRWLAAYPVLLRNTGRDTVLVGTGDSVPLRLEARDVNGRWRTIEEVYSLSSTTGVPSILLPPSQVVLTAVPIPHGPFATQLRLRFGQSCSPSFPGRIHPGQFTPLAEK